jgi:hypothetical protein
LTVGVIVGREAVGPTVFVPIVDVFAENDDLGAVDRLKLLQFG